MKAFAAVGSDRPFPTPRELLRLPGHSCAGDRAARGEVLYALASMDVVSAEPGDRRGARAGRVRRADRLAGRGAAAGKDRGFDLLV